MKRMKSLLWLFSTISLALAACGSSAVDSRQLELDSGVVYQHGSNNPFTGRATYKDSTPGVVDRFYYASAMKAFQGNAITRSPMRCDVDYVKGLVDGKVTCYDAHGETILNFFVHNELLNGQAVINDAYDASKKIARMNWKDGNLSGLQQFYGLNGNPNNTVIDEMTIDNGVKVGKETYRKENGDVLAEGVWNHGKPVSGSFVSASSVGAINQIMTFENGQANGKASYYSTEKDSSGNPLISTGDFVDGKRDGPWIDYSLQVASIDNMLLQMFPILKLYPNYGGILNNCYSYRSNWTHGELKGALACYTEDGSPSLSFDIENGPVANNVIYHLPHSGKVVQLPSIDHDQGALPTSN